MLNRSLFIICLIHLHIPSYKNLQHNKQTMHYPSVAKKFITRESTLVTASSMHYLLAIPNMTPDLTTVP